MTDRQQNLEAILERIRQQRNFDFRGYKRATLQRRIERRIADRRCRNEKDYLALLEREPTECDALVSSMLIKVTSFFRDPEIWQELTNRIIPHLFADKPPEEELRVWCAGCATGEEAYSVAIAVAETLGPVFGNRVKVFGTDLDEAAIAVARRGVYSARQLEHVPRETLDRWFTPSPEGFSVRKEIRRAVVFGVNNLVSDAPISRLDLILCRNVFIYLDSTLQKRVLSRFHYALRREGVLTLGRSELIPFAGKLFETVDLAHRIYRKDGKREFPRAHERHAIPMDHDGTTGRDPVRDGGPLHAHLYRSIIDALDLPVIATGIDGTVVAWNQSAGRLWHRSEPEVVGKRLTALGLPGLTGDLLHERTALVREGHSRVEVAEGTIGTGDASATSILGIEVLPIHDGPRGVVGLLYVVNDRTALRGLESDLRRVNEEVRGSNERLTGANERLRASNEELETTNEELQSANEELQTTNEELQSTNEELETTNEELQSANSELDATNRELAHRTDEMNLLALYQRTIVRSLSSAVVVLGADGRITAWNLAAERLLGLPETEAVGQMLWSLRVPALSRQLLIRVRKTLNEKRALRTEDIEYELPTGGTGHATVAAVPLLDEEVMLGAVIIFDDITRSVALGRENLRLRGPSRKGRA